MRRLEMYVIVDIPRLHKVNSQNHGQLEFGPSSYSPYAKVGPYGL